MAAVALPPMMPRPGSAGGLRSARNPLSPSGTAGGGGGKGHFNAHLTFNSARGLGKNQSCDSDKLRAKLVDVGQRFIGFDKVIEEDTVKRRTVEITRMAAAQESLTKLEKALNSEIKRRVDANKQVQMLTEGFANGMLDALQSNIIFRIEKLASSVESLTLRCTALEKGISQFRGELPSKLQVDTAALVKEISELRRQMELDRQSRIDRDTALLRRLAELETSAASKFEHGYQSLCRDCDKVKSDIDGLARTEDGNNSRTEKFRGFILEEIAGMKNTLAVSAQTREHTDDEIVQAMNQYTNALQKGLHAANNR